MKAAGRRGSGAARQQERKGARPVLSGAKEPAPVVHREPAATNLLQSEPVAFIGSFPDPAVRVEPTGPEIAFIGRSNVGKSSLLNALVGRAGLARVSGSPGKTTLLNFYRTPSLYLVDLPGYGFARASHRARAGYRALVNRYLAHRATLAGVVWLLDIRHQPSKEDREMHQLLADTRRPVLVALTKADKLTRSGALGRAQALARTLGLEPDQLVVTSSRSGLGIAELATSILALGRDNR